MAKSPEEMAATMVANLKEKTGKTLEQWLKVTAKSGLEKHGELVKLLKEDHGMTHGFANLVAHKHRGGTDTPAPEAERIPAQYSGKKEALRPIYDRLETMLLALGEDVEVAPKKAYVSFRRAKQFAIVQPSTQTRVDVGINLKGTEPGGRLEAAGSFNSMVSHRVRIESVKDVNAELKRWLKAAYELA